MMISRWMRIGVLSCTLLVGGVGIAWAQQTPLAPDACGAALSQPGVTRTSAERAVQDNWLCRTVTNARQQRGCVATAWCGRLNQANVFCCPPSVGNPVGRAENTGTTNAQQPAQPDTCGIVNSRQSTPDSTIQLDWTCQIPATGLEGSCRTVSFCSARGAGVQCCAPGAGSEPLNYSVPPPEQECGALNAALPADTKNTSIGADWKCITPATEAAGSTCRPFAGCTTRGSAAKCCPPATVGAVAPVASSAESVTDASTTSPAATPQYNAGRSGGITLPACARSNDPSVAGNCTLDDLIAVAASFANFLMGLAAAVFLILIVWSGARFVLFAADSGTAGEAKSTLVNATIGMVIVFAASIIVRFVMTATTGSATGRGGSSGITETTCVERQGQGFSCQNTASFSTERKRGCVDNLCPGAAEIKCCPNTANPTAGTPAAGTGTTNATQPAAPSAGNGNAAGNTPTTPAR